MDIKILIADDHQIVREGLQLLLQNKLNMQVVGEAENGRIAVQLAGRLKPDIVVMDITMPELNGMEATRQILANTPEVKIIALSMHSDKRFVSRMFKAGVSGYLLKDSAFEELVKAIDTVMNDQIYLSPQIAGVVVQDYVSTMSRNEVSSMSELSPREREVLQLLAEGKNTKEIASFLIVSVKTVESHRKRIMDKLDIRSIAELIKYAIREGITSLDS